MAHSSGRSRVSLPSTPRYLKHITATLIAIAAGISMSPVAGHLSARPGGEDSSSLLLNAQARPVSLAAADFDADGVSDLLAGYATADGGMLVLHRGNVDALYPNTPEARARRLAGQFTSSPFLPGPRALPLPAAPDFLHTGDFDADGYFDAITAARGSRAVVLRGDGTGALGPAEPIALPGVVTALEVGDINGPDGLADVVVGVTGESGSHLLVFAGYDGASQSTPSVIDLPAPATALALGLLDEEHASDIAVAAGPELLFAHGRDRRPRASRAATTATPPIERQTLPFAIQSMSSGDFTGDRRPDLAVVAADGAVHVLTRQADVTASGMGRTTQGSWSSVATMDGVGAGATRILPARTRNRPDDDLVAINQSSGRVQVLGGPDVALRREGAVQVAAVLPMRLDADARDDLVMLRAGEAAPTVQTTLAATTRVVVNTNDSGDGSLHQAILDANAAEGDDLITFDIPGPGPHTIALTSHLPVIKPDVTGTEGAVIIDGTSEPDFAGTPIIELSGALLGPSSRGLTVASSGCVVRGLVFNRFGVGIFFTSEVGPGVIGGLVEGNYIGTDVTGTDALGNLRGLQFGTGPITDGVSEITVGGTTAAARNVISGNGTGIAVTSGAAHMVQGNFIGTDASGEMGLGNTEVGILIRALAEVGGPAPGARNIISANSLDGVLVVESSPVLISHNYIGTDVSGAHALGNGGHGIRVPDGGGTIANNVIAASAGHGVFLESSAFTMMNVLNNRIGTDSSGSLPLGNGGLGIRAAGFSVAFSGNLVSGNGSHGIELYGLENLVQNNLIGTDITGTVALGNQGDGIQVKDLAHTIGGDGDGNVIAFNGGRGVAIELDFPTFVPILSNAIFSNGGLGIDLGGDGLTPNDACDADEHANSPVLTSVTSSASGTTVSGSLNSRPNFSHVLQFFAGADADPSGFGEGATLLGSTTVVTDAACNASFTATLPVPVPANHFVTSTATIVITNGFVQMATSEFSNAIRFVPEASEDAIRALMTQVRDLVAQGELNGLAGFVLTIKLQATLFFVERDLPRVAAVQLRGFSQIVELLVKFRQLDPAHGQALVDAARAIIAGLEGT